MIICGYAGIGKSYLAHNFPNVIDLKSTPFEKDWDEWTSEKNSLLGEHLQYMESGETLYDAIIRFSKLNPNSFCTYDGCPVSNCPLEQCVNPLTNYVKYGINNFL